MWHVAPQGCAHRCCSSQLRPLSQSVFVSVCALYQAEAVQRLHFAINAVRIRMLGSIKSRRQKD